LHHRPSPTPSSLFASPPKPHPILFVCITAQAPTHPLSFCVFPAPTDAARLFRSGVAAGTVSVTVQEGIVADPSGAFSGDCFLWICSDSDTRVDLRLDRYEPAWENAWSTTSIANNNHPVWNEVRGAFHLSHSHSHPPFCLTSWSPFRGDLLGTANPTCFKRWTQCPQQHCIRSLHSICKSDPRHSLLLSPSLAPLPFLLSTCSIAPFDIL